MKSKVTLSLKVKEGASDVIKVQAYEGICDDHFGISEAHLYIIKFLNIHVFFKSEIMGSK